MQAVRDSGAKLRAAAEARDRAGDGASGASAGAAREESSDGEADSTRATGEYVPIPSFVIMAAGDRLGPWPFARLVEAIATGEVGRGDRVEFMGRDPVLIGSITELARFLPALTAATTNRMAGVGVPDFVDSVSRTALVTVLVSVIESEATGVLFAEGPTESRRVLAHATGYSGRKELYFVSGKLAHIASSNASELLGEYLVRRGVITRVELDFALAVLPRYGGRMGDTLASLGLLPSLDVFRAIRDQGRDRLIDLFQWRTGTLTFYKDQRAPARRVPARARAAVAHPGWNRGRRTGRRAGPGLARPPRRLHRTGDDAEAALARGGLAAARAARPRRGAGAAACPRRARRGLERRIDPGERRAPCDRAPARREAPRAPVRARSACPRQCEAAPATGAVNGRIVFRSSSSKRSWSPTK